MPGGLTFSGFESDYAKNNNSTFRKAGEAFTVGSDNTMNNSSVGNSSGSNNQSAYDSWMSAMGNMNSSSNSPNNSSTPAGWTPTSSTNDNSSNSDNTKTKPLNQTPASQATPASQTSGGFTLKPPKSGEEYYADHAEVKAAWNGVYDEDKYRYYVGKDGVSTGADAYHTDMAKYQAQMATMGDNPHLGLVNQMMHPDWKDHNYNGTYGQINQNADYSQAPTGAAYGPGGKKEGMFGSSSGAQKSPGTMKGSYGGNSKTKGWQ